ncbi:co-chaperone GroES [Candidatus Pacearchaeota archaeon]|nr:MAG: co-chaperone GroES [Candidatus Pacearchaeota archaeon]
MVKIRPIGERVLIKPRKTEEKTAGGIYIPAEAKEEKKEGIVEAVGTLKDGKEIPLKKGDRIIYGGYSSEEFEFNNEKYLIIDYKDILGVVEE